MANESLNDIPSSVVVIIPFYNGAAFIERAIRSVLSQTVAADEFLVVNDGSHEPERLALGEIVSRYPGRITILDKANGGQGSARNAGVAASKSEYICFLDQDDYFLDDHVEVLRKAIPKKDVRLGFVYADLNEADGQGNIIHTNMVRNYAVHPKRYLVDLLRQDMFVVPSATIIKRTAYDSVGGIDEQFTGYEDDDLFLRMFRAGFTNYFINKPVTVWCIHTESTSYGIKMNLSRYRYFKKLVSDFPDEKHRDRFYLRDCLVPRWGALFWHDAVKAKLERPEFEKPLREIYEGYRDVICQNKYIPKKLSRHVKRSAFFLKHAPAWCFHTYFWLATLPGLSYMRARMIKSLRTKKQKKPWRETPN